MFNADPLSEARCSSMAWLQPCSTPTDAQGAPLGDYAGLTSPCRPRSGPCPGPCMPCRSLAPFPLLALAVVAAARWLGHRSGRNRALQVAAAGKAHRAATSGGWSAGAGGRPTYSEDCVGLRRAEHAVARRATVLTSTCWCLVLALSKAFGCLRPSGRDPATSSAPRHRGHLSATPRQVGKNYLVYRDQSRRLMLELRGADFRARLSSMEA